MTNIIDGMRLVLTYLTLCENIRYKNKASQCSFVVVWLHRLYARKPKAQPFSL